MAIHFITVDISPIPQELINKSNNDYNKILKHDKTAMHRTYRQTAVYF